MSSSSRGMIQVLGATYRIVRTGSAYEVVRVLDDRVAAAKRSLRHGTLMLDADTLATQMLTDPHHGIDLNS